MHFDKVSDVIDSIPECNPNPVFQALMLLQVALAVHRPILRLGFFTFCFLKPFIQVSKQSCTRCSIQKVSRQICSIFFLIVIIFPKRHGQKNLLPRCKLGRQKSCLWSLSESGKGFEDRFHFIILTFDFQIGVLGFWGDRKSVV